jgi:formylglycine-generating enzyme required for sulfatase activity
MPYLVMPFCERGAAAKLAGKISEDEAWKFLHDVAAGLAYLHSQTPSVIHQDIKPDNVLIDASGQFLITDFGISTKARNTLRKSVTQSNNGGGTLAYMAPERFGQKNLPIKSCDVWSLGASLYELLTGNLPFGEHGGMLLKSGAEIPDMTSEWSSDLKMIVERCLQKETGNRPAAEELVAWTEQHFRGEKIQFDKKNTVSDLLIWAKQYFKRIKKPKSRTVAWGMVLVIAIIMAVWVKNEVEKNRQEQEKIQSIEREAERKRERERQEQETEQKRKDNAKAHFPYSEMMYVDGGAFKMGCTYEQGGNCKNNEKPVHRVTLNSFNIGKYEITQAQWKVIMENDPSSIKGDDFPVTNVSWDEVQDFIRKLNELTGKKYRLPTEAEWEYAARGGIKSKSYKYSGSNNINEIAWYNDNSENTIHVVGSEQANELGIFDMTGNVSEWCSDWYGNYSSAAQTNPKGPSTGGQRIIRGGGWNSVPNNSRVSFRNSVSPWNNTYSELGFRLACSP